MWSVRLEYMYHWAWSQDCLNNNKKYDGFSDTWLWLSKARLMTLSLTLKLLL